MGGQVGPNSRVTSRQIDHQARSRPDSSPEPLEATACDPCVVGRMLRVSMPEVILDLADIHAMQQELRGERMAQGMDGTRLDDPRFDHPFVNRALDRHVADMVPAYPPRARVRRQRRRRKEHMRKMPRRWPHAKSICADT